MNFLKVIFLSLLVSTLTTSAQVREVDARKDKIHEEFNTLAEPQKNKYRELRDKAINARNAEKFLTCLILIDDAEAIFNGYMDLIFLRGICHAQLHDVEKAIICYNKVLAIDPNEFYTLMNIIEINFFSGRYEEAIKYITKVNSILNSRINGQHLPLLDFKHLICLYKLAEKEPDKYKAQIKKVESKYDFMDDNFFYYYAAALKCFSANDKEEGLIWVLKAYLIFENAQMTEVWNKALVDTDYIGAYEIMLNRQESK